MRIYGSNPFYGQNIAADLTRALQPIVQSFIPDPAQIARTEIAKAQIGQANAAAGYDTERTRGVRMTNDAYGALPDVLANFPNAAMENKDNALAGILAAAAGTRQDFSQLGPLLSTAQSTSGAYSPQETSRVQTGTGVQTYDNTQLGAREAEEAARMRQQIAANATLGAASIRARGASADAAAGRAQELRMAQMKPFTVGQGEAALVPNGDGTYRVEYAGPGHNQFTMGNEQERFDADGNLIASGSGVAPSVEETGSRTFLNRAKGAAESLVAAATGGWRDAQAALAGAQTETENAMRQPRVDTETAKRAGEEADAVAAQALAAQRVAEEAQTKAQMAIDADMAEAEKIKLAMEAEEAQARADQLAAQAEQFRARTPALVASDEAQAAERQAGAGYKAAQTETENARRLGLVASDEAQVAERNANANLAGERAATVEARRQPEVDLLGAQTKRNLAAAANGGGSGGSTRQAGVVDDEEWSATMATELGAANAAPFLQMLFRQELSRTGDVGAAMQAAIEQFQAGLVSEGEGWFDGDPRKRYVPRNGGAAPPAAGIAEAATAAPSATPGAIPPAAAPSATPGAIPPAAADAIRQAQDAIQRGKDPNAVRQRLGSILQQYGLTPDDVGIY